VLKGTAHMGGRLVLDLAEVSSVDVAGLALFRELSTRRVIVANCSPYVAELLKGVFDLER
jgi:ABC-type transporter Mla MlaB component